MYTGHSKWGSMLSDSRKAPAIVDGDARDALTSENLTAATLNARLQATDLKFAQVMIQLMTPMLQQGHLSYLEGSGWGYTFQHDVPSSLPVPCTPPSLPPAPLACSPAVNVAPADVDGHSGV